MAAVKCERERPASQVLALCGIVSVQVVFAGYQLLGHAVLQGGLNPIAFSLLREVSASFVFIIAALVFAPRSGWPQRKDLFRFAFCGLSMFGNVFLNLLALTVTTAGMVALLQPTQPVIAALLSSMFGHERMSWQKALGVLLCVVGGVVTTTSAKSIDDGINIGVFLILGQCLSGANYVVQQRPLLRLGYSPLIVSSASYVLASIFTVIVGVVYFFAIGAEARRTVEWWDPSPFFAYVLVYCVLLTTVYNYFIIAWVTGIVGATTVTLFTLLQGVFACSAEYILYKTPVSIGEAIGCLAIFVGLVTVVSARTAYVDTRSEWVQALSSNSQIPCRDSSTPPASSDLPEAA